MKISSFLTTGQLYAGFCGVKTRKNWYVSQDQTSKILSGFFYHYSLLSNVLTLIQIQNSVRKHLSYTRSALRDDLMSNRHAKFGLYHWKRQQKPS